MNLKKSCVSVLGSGICSDGVESAGQGEQCVDVPPSYDADVVDAKAWLIRD